VEKHSIYGAYQGMHQGKPYYHNGSEYFREDGSTWNGSAWIQILTSEETKQQTKSMIHTIAITVTPSQLGAQSGEDEKFLIAPESITANNANLAILLFGAKYADKLKGASSDRTVVNIKSGL